MASEAEKKEVYLEADKEIPGQHYACLSFISPNKILANKNVYLFSEFMKDYEIQYKIKATESFMMAEAKKVQEAAAKAQDVLENLLLKKGGEEGPTDLSGALAELASLRTAYATDLSGALGAIKEMRVTLTRDIAADMEAHVKAEMSDFKTSVIEEAYEAFLYKHKKRLEDEFFAKNNFQTTVQGLKIRGVYDTYNEAQARAKTLQKLDPSFNVYVGQVGFWLPWDPEPSDVGDQEYADEQLNTLMKKYRENESMRDEFYAKTKADRLKDAKVRGAPIAGGATAGADGSAHDMFAGGDLAIARKMEAAAAKAPQNTITHS